MPHTPVPVVFIHGLWLHATSWQPWADLFATHGYTTLTPGWPGEPATVAEARRSPQAVAGHGIDDVTGHYARIIENLDQPPVVIGHSFGGLFAQKLLGMGLARAAVAIDPAQIKGVKPLPFAQLRSSFPVLRNPGNKHKAVALTPSQFRYGFGNALTAEESQALFDQHTIPSPARPLFEAAAANFAKNSPAKVATGNQQRGPLLLISGLADHTVPDTVTRAAHKQYRHSTAITDLKQFPDRGHSLTVDHGWTDIAGYTLDWLTRHNIPATTPAGTRSAQPHP